MIKAPAHARCPPPLGSLDLLPSLSYSKPEDENHLNDQEHHCILNTSISSSPSKSWFGVKLLPDRKLLSFVPKTKSSWTGWLAFVRLASSCLS